MRNGQGDITGILNGAGTQVVTYVYDSWGKLISTTDTSGQNVGIKNTYRYRGYRYDTETGLYYLQSRYYSPEWGRFLNADAAIGQVGNIQGHNMFAYAFNNPIMYSDPVGDWPLRQVLTGLAIAAGAVMVATVAVAAGGLLLAATGVSVPVSIAVAAAAAGKAGMVVAGAAAGMAAYESLPKDHTVYGLVDGAGKTQYVGRTVNPTKRERAHQADPNKAGLRFETIAPNLNALEARGLEQMAMVYHHTINTGSRMNNQINGVSPSNRLRGLYMELGGGVSYYLGNQLSNEVLYWSGR